jgi:amphi-Trp domain-containing protein
MKRSNRFRHESLQSQESIQNLMEALTKGLASGKVVFEDEDDSMLMEPQGLLRLKISASQDEDRSRIDVRISWKEEEDIPKDKNLKITSK